MSLTFLFAGCGENTPVVNSTTGANGDNTPPENSPDTTVDLAAEYRKITAVEAKQMMDGTDPYVLLDVRTEQEYKQQRISGAILIPDTDVVSRAPEEMPDKNAIILVYCRSGRRSAAASKNLVQMGYINVYDFGGIIDWPYETISD